MSSARVGRPSLTGGQGSSPRITIRLAPATMIALEAEAERTQTTAAGLARQLVEEGLARRITTRKEER